MSDERGETDGTQPDSTEPDSIDPGSAEPDSVDPGSAEPDSVDPGSAEPDGAEPAGAQPDIATDVAATDREAAANDAAERTRRVTARSAARWGARAVAAAAVVALAAGGVWVAQQPAAVDAHAAPALTVTPSAPVQTRVCAGPLIRVGAADGTSPGAISSLGAPTLSTSDPAAEAGGVTIVDDTEGGSTGTLVLHGSPAPLAAAQIADVDTDAQLGLAASECDEPATDQWIVGGSTTTGRSSVLTIANPSETAATVDLQMHDAAGEVQLVGGSGIAVQPGTEIALDLAGLAPNAASPVIRITSTGAPVAAHLQQTTTRGLARGGVDIVDAGATASTDVVIPGVVIAEPTGVAATAGYEDTAPALRIYSAVTVEIEVTSAQNGQEPVTSELTLTGGQVTELDLSTFAPGEHAFTLHSDAPIVAGVRQTAVAASGESDFDWIASATPLASQSPIVVPDGPNPRVHLVNATDAEQTVSLDGREATVAPGGQVSVAVEPGVHDMQGTGFAASVTYGDESSVAGFSVSPAGPTGDGVTVVF